MTKTEARAYATRCREALRGFELALRDNDGEALHDWAGEAMGSVAALQQYADDLNGDQSW